MSALSWVATRIKQIPFVPWGEKREQAADPLFAGEGQQDEVAGAVEAATHLPEDMPLGELLECLRAAHHEFTRLEIPRLSTLAEKARLAEGKGCEVLLSALGRELRQVQLELEEHTAKEEDVLFTLVHSLVKSGREARMESFPELTILSKLKHEHRTGGERLARIRRMTGNYHVPDDASPDLRELYEQLRTFEGAVLLHIYVEEHVVIPRAMAIARGEHDRAAGA